MLTLRFNATILLHFKMSEDSLFSLMMKPEKSLCMHLHPCSLIHLCQLHDMNAKRRPEHAHFLLSDKINLDYYNPIFLQFS